MGLTSRCFLKSERSELVAQAAEKRERDANQSHMESTSGCFEMNNEEFVQPERSELIAQTDEKRERDANQSHMESTSGCFEMNNEEFVQLR